MCVYSSVEGQLDDLNREDDKVTTDPRSEEEIWKYNFLPPKLRNKNYDFFFLFNHRLSPLELGVGDYHL